MTLKELKETPQDIKTMQRTVLAKHGQELQRFYHEMNAGLAPSDAKRLGDIINGQDNSVRAHIVTLLSLFETNTSQKTEDPDAIQYIPFFLGGVGEYTASSKYLILDRFLDTFIREVETLIRENSKSFFKLSNELNTHTYQIVKQIFLKDLLDKILSLAVFPMLFSQNNIEFITACQNDFETKDVLEHCRFLVELQVPTNYPELFNLMTFMARYAVENKEYLMTQIASAGLIPAMELYLVFATYSYALVKKAAPLQVSSSLYNRFSCEYTRQAQIDQEKNVPKIVLHMLWENKTDLDLLLRMVTFFYSSKCLDPVKFRKSILQICRKNEDISMTNDLSTAWSNGQHKHIIVMISNLIHLAEKNACRDF
jgi:hypothetical protein